MIRFTALIKIYYLLPLDPSPSICARKGLVYSPSLWFKLTRRLAPNPPPALTSRRGAHFVLSSHPAFVASTSWDKRAQFGTPTELIVYQLSVLNFAVL